VTKRPFLGQDGSNTRVTDAHFRPSINKINAHYGVYGLVFRSPCSTSNASAIRTETSKNVTKRPFLDQDGSIASATDAPFRPSNYETVDCYGAYGLLFRFPCSTSNTSAIRTETIEYVTKRPFLGQDGSNTRVTDAHFRPSINKINVCKGSTDQNLDPLGPPQIQVQFITSISRNVTKRPFLDQDGSNARSTNLHYYPSIHTTNVYYFLSSCW
jgi:hypothetical protein